MFAGKNTPAFTAWAVFSVITFVNCLTYLGWTATWINIMLLFTDFIICFFTSIFILIRIGWKVHIDWKDKLVVAISLAAILLWVIYNAAAYGNLFNQIAYSVAFIPTYRNVWNNPRNEPTRVWFVWTIAFVLNIVALVIQPTTQTMDYVSPVVCLVHHVAVTILSMRKMKIK